MSYPRRENRSGGDPTSMAIARLLGERLNKAVSGERSGDRDFLDTESFFGISNSEVDVFFGRKNQEPQNPEAWTQEMKNYLENFKNMREQLERKEGGVQGSQTLVEKPGAPSIGDRRAAPAKGERERQGEGKSS